jgi:hypothetical protein
VLRVETTADAGMNYNTALYLFLCVTTCHVNDISSSRALGGTIIILEIFKSAYPHGNFYYCWFQAAVLFL